MAINSLTKIYDGNDISGAVPNVVYLPILKNGTIVSIDVLTDLNVSGANAVFSVSKNGAVISGLSPTIAIGSRIGTVSGLNIAVVKGDEIILNLVSGAVSSPITFNLDVDDGVAAGGGAAVETDFISGLELVWNSATGLTVKQGAAYIPSLGAILRVPSDIVKSGISFSSGFYYVYLFKNGMAADVEFSTVAPTFYNGNASSKTGDNTRRCIGSVFGIASGLVNFVSRIRSNVLEVTWITNQNIAPFRVLSGGNSAGVNVVDVSSVIPDIIFDSIQITPTFGLQAGGDAYFGVGADLDPSLTYPSASGDVALRAQNNSGGFVYNGYPSFWVKLLARQLKYHFGQFAGSSSNLYIDTRGFSVRR